MCSPATTASGPVGWFVNSTASSWRCLSPSHDAFGFHRSLPGYAPTPLVEVPSLAAELQVGRVFVKDEAARFDLRAFKFLGSSWATYRVVTEASSYTGAPTTAGLAAHLATTASPISLVAATDGNHGRAVARMGKTLGLPVHVYAPDVVPAQVIERITSEGSAVTVLPANYDATVAAAQLAAAEAPHAILIQDTALPGYTEIPGWIVDGYATLLLEIDEQLAAADAAVPDLIVVPAGVGSLAQAAVVHHRSRRSPCAVMSVEADTAACIIASLRAGELTTVETGFTVMNGLNCGTPSPLAWPVLRDGLDAAIAVSDEQTLAAVTDFSDVDIVSGPSGAACLAGARAALLGHGSRGRREALDLGPESVVVCINTEGFASAQVTTNSTKT